MAKHQYTILSMMKDEGHSLVEWVAYHKHIGFDNICVYTNDCGDGTDAMLMRLQDLGWVQHFRNDVPEDKKPQPNALALASVNPEIIDSEWVLTMDADEFVSVKTGRGWISDVFERIPPETDAIAITWRFFGSSELTDWNPGLVTENYTQAAPDKFRKGWGVKSMFRPKRDMKFGIHRPTIMKGRVQRLGDDADILQHWVNGSGEPMPITFNEKGWRSTGKTLGYKLVEMNHYAVKSYQAYLLRRVRGNVNNKADKYNASYFAIFDRNEIESRNAVRHARAVKKKMAEILSDPIMRDLQDKAHAFHEARVQVMKTSGEYDQSLAELKEASAVPITGLDEILFTQHLPKEWQAKIKEMQASGIPDADIARMVAQSVGIKGKKDDSDAAADGAVSIPTRDGTSDVETPDGTTAKPSAPTKPAPRRPYRKKSRVKGATTKRSAKPKTLNKTAPTKSKRGKTIAKTSSATALATKTGPSKRAAANAAAPVKTATLPKAKITSKKRNPKPKTATKKATFK